MSRRPRSGAFAVTILGLALVSVVGCTAPSSVPDARDARATGEAFAPSLIDAPRVREAGRRGWVEVDAEVLASDEESPSAARRRAIERARSAAVEWVAGVAVRTSVVTLDQVTGGRATDLIQALTATQARALIVDEKLLDHRLVLDPGGGFRVRVTLAARVLEHAAARAGFETEVRLDDHEYRDGERVELAVRTSEAARIYVLAVSDEGAVVLLPNRHMPDTRVEADRWLEFPGKALERRGVSLRAMLPPGRDEAREALIVVALRGGRRLENLFPASGETFRSADSGGAMALASEFLSPLLSLPAEDWTFDQRVYSITRR